MDIHMAELDGPETPRRILTVDRIAGVLMLTTFNLDEYVYEATRAGAGGFVLAAVVPRILGSWTTRGSAASCSSATPP
jgi:DNA-binding NarL/FixJ family response regulator